MKKVTIITPPEYESILIESLGNARVTQLKPVTGPGFEELLSESSKVDYEAISKRVHEHYEKLMILSQGDISRVTPSNEELRRFTAAPESEADSLIKELGAIMEHLRELRERQHKDKEQLITELQRAVDAKKSSFEQDKSSLKGDLSSLEIKKIQMEQELSKRVEGTKARLESVRALKPEEFKSCFAVGLVYKELVSRLEEYLKQYPSIWHRTVSVTPEKSFIFVFGPEEGRKWVEALFLVFEVEDIFDVLDTRDILLVLDPEKRKAVIQKYEEELKKIEAENTQSKELEERFEADIGAMENKLQALEDKHESEITEIKRQYNDRLNELESLYEEKVTALKAEHDKSFGKISYMDYLLHILTNKRAPVLRSKVISVVQGWVPEYNVTALESAIKDVEGQLGERLFYEVEDPSPDDQSIPNPEPKFKPSFLQPAWTLTYLRGWPSPLEINPGYISILVFSFQFGLMYGDLGQGLVFMLVGIFLYRKYKTVGHGMMYRLGGLFIPMGISAMIFGILYDSIFLMEGLLFHHHQIMPNPVHETTTLMKLVFTIAMVEVVIGLILGAINQIKEGNPIGAIGEHGLGMILYVVGLYQTAMYFISIGMDFMTALGSPWFLVAIAGIFLSFLEPVVHSVTHGHGIGMKAIGEGVGGLLMTFVEGLANLFSFLRIAAFALAHASLAVAAEALSHSLGIAGVGLIIMNVIAMSFEFVSSTVQSLRLLYYEFMGKFFQGGGIPFRPFTMRVANKK